MLTTHAKVLKMLEVLRWCDCDNLRFERRAMVICVQVDTTAHTFQLGLSVCFSCRSTTQEDANTYYRIRCQVKITA